MKTFPALWLKNGMLIGNLFANGVSLALVGFLMAANLCLWLGAYLFYSTMLVRSGLGTLEFGGGFLRFLFTSLVTMIFAFFVLQTIQQRWLSPFFFPQGGIHQTRGALRIRIATRLTAMLFACNIVPLTGLLHVLHALPRAEAPPEPAVSSIVPTLTLDIAVFMVMGIWVTFLVTRNFTRPLQSMTRVLRGIQQGDLDERVRVTTNDEIGYSGDAINEMAAGLKERDMVKDTFGKYVSEEVRDEILSGRIPLDGEAREVTVLFADLRNFTPMVEITPPKVVVQVINRYFQEMEEAVHRHRGLVLQYIGDEIEAVFGAPVPQEDHPTDAVRAALEMRERLEVLNRVLEAQGLPTLSHGIGIHTGRVVAANIGSSNRLSYALVGDTVNLASRLQGLTRDLGTDIILSRATREGLSHEIPLEPLPSSHVKGRTRKVEIFTLS